MAEKAAVRTEKTRPELYREHLPEEREPEVSANAEQQIMIAVAAITGISSAELNRLPVEVKSDIIAEFRENNGNIPSEQLTERICNIAELKPPEQVNNAEQTISSQAEQKKDSQKRQAPSDLDKPLFSRSKIMSEKYSPTSSKSAEDIERDRQNKDRGTAL